MAQRAAVATFMKRIAGLPQPGAVKLALDDASGVARLTLANAERRKKHANS